jgi:hypothetical protein
VRTDDDLAGKEAEGGLMRWRQKWLIALKLTNGGGLSFRHLTRNYIRASPLSGPKIWL